LFKQTATDDAILECPEVSGAPLFPARSFKVFGLELPNLIVGGNIITAGCSVNGPILGQPRLVEAKPV
jgi:hypothetical protein